MTITRLIPKDFLLDVLDFDRYIENKITGHSRWNVHHAMIFMYEDKASRVYYSRGATESQDEMPFDYEGPEVSCVEVVPVEVTRTEYRVAEA